MLHGFDDGARVLVIIQQSGSAELIRDVVEICSNVIYSNLLMYQQNERDIDDAHKWLDNSAN